MKTRKTNFFSRAKFLLGKRLLGGPQPPEPFKIVPEKGDTIVMSPPELGDQYTFIINTPEKDVNEGADLAIRALWQGAIEKATIIVPTVSGGTGYPSWVHPYDNYWINRVSSYFFPRESVEWPIRLFATYQSPIGEIGGGVYDIPDSGWWQEWEKVDGPKKWQGHVARPIADLIIDMSKEPEKVRYGIYVRDHFFVLMVDDQWLAHGHLPFLIEMYGPCRRSLKYLEKYHDIDHNGLIETTCILSDLPVDGDKDINSTERSEDQAILYGALLAFADMAHLLGGFEDENWAKNWANRIKEQLDPIFWRPEGRYMFGIDRVSKKPKLDYMTTTYTNGYAILFGLTDIAKTTAILDYLGKQEFEVPGPYHIPPVKPEDKPQNRPGVYCNGGCGWGRGIMPSVALSCYANGRPDQGFDYLKRQGAAARKAGSFHEYWEWEKYTGKAKPGGQPWYGETSAGFLDVLLHGTFGIQSPNPGYNSLQIYPQFPKDWPYAKLDLYLPNNTRLEIKYQHEGASVALTIVGAKNLHIDIVLPWYGTDVPTIEGQEITNTKIERKGQHWVGMGHMMGNGKFCLKSVSPPEFKQEIIK